jgi:hypothetical protein
MTDRDLSRCPVCGTATAGGAPALAAHLVEQADKSDGAHVMWLNRTVTKHQTGAVELAALLLAWASATPSEQDRVKR